MEKVSTGDVSNNVSKVVYLKQKRRNVAWKNLWRRCQGDTASFNCFDRDH